MVIAHDLEDFLNGSRPCLPRFLDLESQERNPDHTLWQCMNHLVMSCICSSMSETMITQIVRFDTTADIWSALQQIFAASAMSRITKLRTKLRLTKKEGLIAMEYIQCFTFVCNNLATIGEPVSWKDYLIYFFGGLAKEYNSFVTSINNRPDQLSVEEIHSQLLSYEYRLEQQSADAQVTIPQANVTQISPTNQP